MVSFNIDGFDYSEEEIETYKKGRQTKGRIHVITEWEKLFKDYKNSDEYVNENIQNQTKNKNGDVVNFDDISSIDGLDQITVDDFVNRFYRDYWNEQNRSRNAIVVSDGLSEVTRKIIYAAYKINLKPNQTHKFAELMGEVSKYHAHGDSSIEGAIKGSAAEFRSQPGGLLIKGIGNFGYAPGDTGAAPRYLNVKGTPALSHIFKDIPFIETNSDDTGLEQPNYVPTPVPYALINQNRAIGTGESTYIAERRANEVIDWVEYLASHNWQSKPYTGKYKFGEVPEPISDSGSTAEYNPKNGYVYYFANVHFGVDPKDINKKGNYDVITEFPPGIKANEFIDRIHKDYENTKYDRDLENGRGEDKPVWIAIPSGLISRRNHENWYTLKLQTARKEKIMIWDDDDNSMYKGTLEDLAEGWYRTRKKITGKRLQYQIHILQDQNHKLNLIKEFIENDMQTWKEKQIAEFFTKFSEENGVYQTENEQQNKIQLTPEEQGKRDADILLSMSARTFLPENLGKNELSRIANNDSIKELEDNYNNIQDFIFKEAREVLTEQNEFFE